MSVADGNLETIRSEGGCQHELIYSHFSHVIKGMLGYKIKGDRCDQTHGSSVVRASQALWQVVGSNPTCVFFSHPFPS